MGQLMWIVRKRGYANGWAAHKFKSIYDMWPPRGLKWEDKVDVPTVELMHFIYQETHKWAKRQRYAQKKAEQTHARGGFTQRERREMQEVEAYNKRYVEGTLCTDKDLEDFK